MTKVILVEDNNDLRMLTRQFLVSNGYSVFDVSCAEDLLDAPSEPDIYVIDLNLPETDGYELITNIRKGSSRVGIIILSARERTADITLGYEVGADIYLTKPVDPRVLLAALKRISVRSAPATVEEEALRVDVQSRRVHGLKDSASLSEAEVQLLYKLSIAGERGLERWEVAEVLGMDIDTRFGKAMEVRISRLRKKLQSCGALGVTIEPLRMVGYRLLQRMTFEP